MRELRKQDLAVLAQATASLKSSTRYLLEAIATGNEPRHAAKVDFGLETDRHFEALRRSVLSGKISPEMLDASIGNGKVLTALVKTDRDNPHQGIVFEMRWYDLLKQRLPAERAAMQPEGNTVQAPDGQRRHEASAELVSAVALDLWPGERTCAVFGIRSQEHYEALALPLRHGEITREQLEAGFGDGAKLTGLVNGASRNPHNGIVFDTSLPPPNQVDVQRLPPKSNSREMELEM